MMILSKSIVKSAWDYSPYVIFSLGSLVVLKKCIGIITVKFNNRRRLQKWKTSPKDVVILHGLKRGKLTPSPSPFVLKLETFLRMANIPYELDIDFPMGEKGKTPWITLNGQHYYDSKTIIDFLIKKFSLDIGSNLTDEQLAVGHLVEIATEEYLYWAGVQWRYLSDQGRAGLHLVFDYPPMVIKMLLSPFFKSMRKALYYQGLGRHSQEQVDIFVVQTLTAISKLMGDKKFICGESPSKYDASAFGLFAQIKWAAPNSPHQKSIQDLKNLDDWAIRMKELYWPDWENCLAGKKAVMD